MPYYDAIAAQWHAATGYKGGSLKRHVLNDALLARVPDIAGRAILELGAGNGYFMPLLRERFSGQEPERLVVTDISIRLLALARQHFNLSGADYRQLDVRAPFPFADASFDLILASMVFNEISTPGLKRALAECRRVIRPDGRILITITHPDFIGSLDRRGQLKRAPDGQLTMPGAGRLRLPIVPRRLRDYERLLAAADFGWQLTELRATPAVLREKPGLRRDARRPIVALFDCQNM